LSLPQQLPHQLPVVIHYVKDKYIIYLHCLLLKMAVSFHICKKPLHYVCTTQRKNSLAEQKAMDKKFGATESPGTQNR
jgi:hypothetical protein